MKSDDATWTISDLTVEAREIIGGTLAEIASSLAKQGQYLRADHLLTAEKIVMATPAPAPQTREELIDLLAEAYAFGHWDGMTEGYHFDHDQARAHFLADVPRVIAAKLTALHPEPERLEATIGGKVCSHGHGVLVTHITDGEPCTDYLLAARSGGAK